MARHEAAALEAIGVGERVMYMGDCCEGMREFLRQGRCVQMCVTSPPYWGLRDYGTAQWEGGSEDCDHVGITARTVSGGVGKQYTNEGSNRVFSGDCACGARRIDRQLGLEPTIAEYVESLVGVFRLVRDLLADDGTLWLNLGDSYGGSGKGPDGKRSDITNRAAGVAKPYTDDTIKPKDLCGIPWRVAFALQADGWYLRSDIIWAKPNPMPESVTDRPTKAHKYLFLLSKRERYYYDAGAIAEPANWPEGSWSRSKCYDNDSTGKLRSFYGDGRKWTGGELRNRRSVWTIATEAFPDAHFSTFPQALVEPCIMAGSRVGDVVLDPFMGSGTVAQVAQDLGRRWLGCELSPEYAKMIERRSRQSAFALEAAD